MLKALIGCFIFNFLHLSYTKKPPGYCIANFVPISSLYYKNTGIQTKNGIKVAGLFPKYILLN